MSDPEYRLADERDLILADAEILKLRAVIKKSEENLEYAQKRWNFYQEMAAMYKEALQEIASHVCHPDCNHHEIAKQALSPETGK